MLQESEWCINTLPAHPVPLEMDLFPPFLCLVSPPLCSHYTCMCCFSCLSLQQIRQRPELEEAELTPSHLGCSCVSPLE